MAGRDKINPKANEWMEREGLDVSPKLTVKPKKLERNMAGQVQRVARRLGKKPDDMAAEIPKDTLRRLKYPVLEQRNPDGTRSFQHDLGISDGPISR